MIKQIEIRNLLPCVFAGMEDTDRIRSSQIWEERILSVSSIPANTQGRRFLISICFIISDYR